MGLAPPRLGLGWGCFPIAGARPPLMPHLAFQPSQGDTPSGDGFMRYVLVLQFPAKDLTDYDDLVELEERLEKRLGDDLDIDGHDFGSGEGNIFIFTGDPEKTFREIKSELTFEELKVIRVAYRPDDSHQYTILWPFELQEFQVIC